MMNLNRNLLLIIGAVVIGINTFGLAYLITQQNSSTVAANEATPKAATYVFPKGNNNSESFKAIDNKMVHLSHEMVEAMNEINNLKKALTTVNKKLQAQGENNIVEPQLTQTEMQQQKAEAKQQYVLNLQSAPRNDAWASQMEDEMLSSIETAQLNGFNQQGLSVQGVECYSDNCLIDVNLGDSDNESLILAMLPWAVTAEFIPSDDDALTGRMVITKI